MAEELDTGNHFAVGVANNAIVIRRTPSAMSKREALVLAAWLVALADDGDKFPAILEAVQNT